MNFPEDHELVLRLCVLLPEDVPLGPHLARRPQQRQGVGGTPPLQVLLEGVERDGLLVRDVDLERSVEGGDGRQSTLVILDGNLFWLEIWLEIITFCQYV